MADKRTVLDSLQAPLPVRKKCLPGAVRAQLYALIFLIIIAFGVPFLGEPATKVHEIVGMAIPLLMITIVLTIYFNRKKVSQVEKT